MSEKVLPIKPSEINKLKIETIPDEMIKAVNSLILKKWNGTSAIIKQDDIVNEYLDNLKISEHPDEIDIRLERGKVFEYNWLDFEDIYRNAGWRVKFDKPGYNETYEPFFVFSKK